VKEGANYGWPFANPNPDKGMDRMPFDPDYETNRDWSQVPESSFTRIDKGIPAHSAPLGFSFLPGNEVPLSYRNGAVVALHGSWNRSRKTGYKVILFPWLPSGEPGAQLDLVTGWLNDQTQGAWGRPVDVVPDPEGNLLISDDLSGTIYKLSFGR
jgi:glucose/arabinose dehydrogenase